MDLAEQLFGLYARRIYPVLVWNDPVYQACLNKAGLGLTPVSAIPPQHRDSFEQEMKMQSWLAARKVMEARSLDPSTVRAKLLAGQQTIYRVTDDALPSGSTGIWWFNENVAQRCRQECGPDPQKRLEWLRSVLAVCFNFGAFNKIQRLTLHGGEEIPAILGRGLPMPHYKFDPYIDRKTGRQVIAEFPPDYWQKKGQFLLGGELQIVLPWIPVRRVATTASL